MSKWFQIRARDTRIRPNGLVLQVWLCADSRKHLDNRLKKKGYYTDIEWIREEIPSWEK